MSTGRAGQGRLGAADSGLYRTANAQSPALVSAAGLDVVPIRLAGVASKGALLERFAATLEFPDWFGGNWDALEDCLGDLSWRPPGDRVLLIEGFESLASVSHHDFRVLLDLLADVAEHWSAQGRAFVVLFVDPERKLGLRPWGDAPA